MFGDSDSSTKLSTALVFRIFGIFRCLVPAGPPFTPSLPLETFVNFQTATANPPPLLPSKMDEKLRHQGKLQKRAGEKKPRTNNHHERRLQRANNALPLQGAEQGATQALTNGDGKLSLLTIGNHAPITTSTTIATSRLRTRR